MDDDKHARFKCKQFNSPIFGFPAECLFKHIGTSFVGFCCFERYHLHPSPEERFEV